MTDLEARFEEVNPVKAAKWLEAVNHESQIALQRPIRQNWVSHLAKEMSLGRFVPSATIYFGFQNGTTYLLNGQHTLNAIIESGTQQTLPIVRHKTKSVDDLKKVYYRADGGLKRSFSDSVRALDAINVTGLSNFDFQVMDSALRFAQGRFARQRNAIFSYDDRVAACMMWADEYRLLKGCIAGGVQSVVKSIGNRAVMSVALLTIRCQLEKAKEFWYQVAHDDMLAATDARKTFHRWLLTARAQGGGSGASNIFTSESFAYATSRAWAAFYENRELTRIIASHKQVAELPGIDLEAVFSELDDIYNYSVL